MQNSLIWSVNENLTRLCHTRNDFNSFRQTFVCDWMWLAEKRLFFMVVATRLFCKAMSTISTKQCPSQLILPKWNIQAVTEHIHNPNFRFSFNVGCGHIFGSPKRLHDKIHIPYRFRPIFAPLQHKNLWPHIKKN